jgi:hypothetical protein
MRASMSSIRASNVAGVTALALGALLACACGPGTPAPATTPTATAKPAELPPPAAEPIETDKDCVKATTECGGGVCLAKVKNDCELPVTCELNILATCSAATSSGDARSKGRATIPAKTENEFSAAGDCEGAKVELTTAESMTCK